MIFLDVKQCDRCGAIYRPNTVEKVHTHHRISLDCLNKDRDCRNVKLHGSMDLCPNCANELTLFMDKYGKLGIRTNF